SSAAQGTSGLLALLIDHQAGGTCMTTHKPAGRIVTADEIATTTGLAKQHFLNSPEVPCAALLR
ncbi:MAG: hypothetical protein AAFO79_06385, partial [Pseudomonadota bacterium]